MSFYTVETSVASAVATSGTFTVGYPTGTDSGSYQGTRGHKMYVRDHQALYSYISGFTMSFGAASITVTYLGSTTIPAGSVIQIQLDEVGADDDADLLDDNIQGVGNMFPVVIDLRAPDVADADGISASASVGAAGSAVIGGALASGGVATFDVPRNVVGAWTTASVITVTGTDDPGDVMVESAASGTTYAGKKAFKTITSVVSSASITGATFGTGDVLGLPIRLGATGYVIAELQDGVDATAGTVVAAVDTAATATTGDVRGTYDPNAAADGAKAFQLLAMVNDPTDTGGAQYAG